jgi:hypothetical protein
MARSKFCQAYDLGPYCSLNERSITKSAHLAFLILSVSNVPLYSSLSPGGEGGPRCKRVGSRRTWITELRKTSIFVQLTYAGADVALGQRPN